MLAPERAASVTAGKGSVICFVCVTPAAVAALSDGFYRNTDLSLADIRAASDAGTGRVFWRLRPQSIARRKASCQRLLPLRPPLTVVAPRPAWKTRM